MIFDEKIRSIMENGSEEVPAGLWEAVESRIPAGSGKKKGALVWLWSTGAALSAAAAVVLAVIFTGQKGAEDRVDIIDSGSGILTDVPGGSVAAPENDGMAVENDGAAAPENISGQTGKPSVTRTFIPQAVTDDISGAAENAEQAEETDSTVPSGEADSQAGAGRTGTPVPAAEAAPAGNAAAVESTQAAEGNASAAASDGIVESREFDENGKELERRKTRTGAASFEAFGNALSGLAKSGTADKAPSAPGRMLARKAPTANSVEPTSDRKYGLPMSFGVGVKIPLAPKWSLGVGLDASLLTNSFAGNYTKVGEDMFIESYVFPNIRNTQVYLGLPVNVYYSIINNSFLDFYAYGGGSVEKCLLNKYSMYGDPEKLNFKDKTGGVQGSVDVGLGIEFIVAKKLGIFLDPSVRYYINGKNSPKSIRTAQPLMVGGELGLRVRL